MSRCPGELLILALTTSGSDYVYAINTLRNDGYLLAQDRKVKSLTIPEDLLTRIESIPPDMFIKNLSIGPDGEWFLQYADANGKNDRAFWDVPYSLCADFLQARFRSGEVSDFVVAFGPNLSYVILDGDEGFVMSKNVSSDLRARIMKIRKSSQGMIYALTLFPSGGFFIRDSEGIAYSGAPRALSNELNENGVIDILNIHVAVDYSWVVLRRESVAFNGICEPLQEVLQKHYQQHSLDRQPLSSNTQEFQPSEGKHDKKLEKSKSKKEERRLAKEMAKKSTEHEKITAAMKKRLLVQRITIANAKGLKPGIMVTVAGLSRKPGDCTIQNVTGDGIMIVSRNNVDLPHVAVDDMRRLSPYFRDDSPRIEMVKLVKATDKFEAAVVNLLCPICRQKVCTCSGVDVHKLQSSAFSRSSDATPMTKDMSDHGWDTSGRNSCADSWDGPSLQSEADSECPLSSSRSLHPDEIKSLICGDEPLQIDRVDFLPIFESKGERLLYDEHKCPEKIDFVRLVRVLRDLRKDRVARLTCIESLSEKSKTASKDSKVFSFYSRKLKFCQELDLIVEALYCILKEYPVSEDGCVIHEVQYEYRDELCRGTLFAIGKSIHFDDRRYPRNTTLQAIHFDLLPTLCGAFGHYVEIENSLARILCSIAHLMDLSPLIPTLIDYRDNFHSWTERLAKYHKITEEAARKWPNIIMMGEIFVYKSWLRSVGAAEADSDEISFAFKLAVEVAVLTDEILRHRKFKWAVDRSNDLEASSPSNFRSLVLTRVVQSCQNDLLSHIQRCCYNLGWITRSKAFDSVILEKSRDAKTSLSDALKMCQTSCAMNGWDLKLVEVNMHGMQDNSIKSIQDARMVLAQLNKTAAS